MVHYDVDPHKEGFVRLAAKLLHNPPPVFVFTIENYFLGEP